MCWICWYDGHRHDIKHVGLNGDGVIIWAYVDGYETLMMRRWEYQHSHEYRHGHETLMMTYREYWYNREYQLTTLGPVAPKRESDPQVVFD
ncbi:hypothetical protein ACLOJK_007641 [Asimina triloba]